MGLDTKDRIIIELYRTCEILGGKSDLLSILGSYGDTLDDEEVLEYLVEYNKHEG